MAPEDRDSPACPRLLGGGAGWDGLGTPSLTGCPVPVGERRSGALGSPEQSTPPFKHHLVHLAKPAREQPPSLHLCSKALVQQDNNVWHGWAGQGEVCAS